MTKKMIVILVSMLLGSLLHAESSDEAFSVFGAEDVESWNDSSRVPEEKKSQQKKKKKNKRNKKSRSHSLRKSESSYRSSKQEPSWQDDFNTDRHFVPEGTDPEWKVSSYRYEESKKTIVRIRPLIGINIFTVTGVDSARGQNGLTGEDAFGNDDPEYNNIVTPSGGVGVEVGLTRYLSIDTGVNLFQSGAEAKDKGIGGGLGWDNWYIGGVDHDRTDKLSLTYLGVPVLAKFAVTGVKDGGFYLKIGLMPAFLLDAEIDRKDVDYTSGTWDAKKQVEDFDLFASAGLGWDLFVSRSIAIIFAGDIQAGLLDVIKDAHGEQRNLGGSFGLGVGIQL